MVVRDNPTSVITEVIAIMVTKITISGAVVLGVALLSSRFAVLCGPVVMAQSTGEISGQPPTPVTPPAGPAGRDKPGPVASRADDRAQPPGEQYRAILADYDAAAREFQKALASAKTDEDRGKAFRDRFPNPADFAKRLLLLARAHPNDAVAVDALCGSARTCLKSSAVPILK
jgi:hypothetical protein